MYEFRNNIILYSFKYFEIILKYLGNCVNHFVQAEIRSRHNRYYLINGVFAHVVSHVTFHFIDPLPKYSFVHLCIESDG